MKFRLGIACGLLAVALTGCGGGDPDDPDASTTPTTAATSSSPSEEPSETFDPTKETAKQFLRRWIRLDHKAQTTGDVDSYLAITSDQCRSCQQFADRIEEIYSRGGWIETNRGRLVSATHDAKAQWSVEIRSGPTRYAEKQGGQVETFPGGTVTFVVYIVRDDRQRWVLTSYAEKGA